MQTARRRLAAVLGLAGVVALAAAVRPTAQTAATPPQSAPSARIKLDIDRTIGTVDPLRERKRISPTGPAARLTRRPRCDTFFRWCNRLHTGEGAAPWYDASREGDTTGGET